MTAKGNQEHLLADIQGSFARAFDTDFAGREHDTYETRERGHGREESRRYTALPEAAGWRQREAWAGLTTLGRCYRERTARGETTTEVRYFIAGKKARAK